MQDNKDGEVKSCNQFGHFRLVLIICAFYSILNAQSFSEFKRSQADAFKQYKSENDKVFNNYLKSNWEEYSSKKPQVLYELPKPSKISPAVKRKVKKLGPKVHIDIQGESKKVLDENIITIRINDMSEVSNKDIDFNFFGTQLGLNTPLGIRSAKFYPQNQKGISNFFNTVVTLEYEVFLLDIQKMMKELNLNDWGKYLLVKKISENIFSSQDDSRLLSWLIFNKLGYSLRVGLANRHVIVMFNSEKIIYDTPRYTIDNKKFYVLSNYAKGSVGKLYTYEHNYPEANKALDLSLLHLPNLIEDKQSKQLEFKEGIKKYNIEYSYNQNLIDFMSTYPQADYETFFNAPIDTQSYEDIVNGLRKHINTKSSSEAINFVLHFVQSAFKYEVDAKQFGREKVMFAQETLYYSNSDCEDRAILFAYLVKKLFKVGVVGVKYKDHMATALYIPIKGDSVKVNSRKFIIADPTYLNSNIGQSMQRYKSKRPKAFIYLEQVKG